jgi:hypothetical protein
MTESIENQAGNMLERMNVIEKKFRGDGKMTIIFIAVIFCGIGYFWWGITALAPSAEPKELVAMLVVPIDNNIESMRKTLTKELVAAAPGFAEELSSQAIEAMPKARQTLEDYVVKQLETEIDTVTNKGADGFVRVLRENRVEFEDTLKKLAKGEDMTDTTVKIFVDAISKEMGADMHDQAEQVLGTLIALREKGEKLQAGSELTFVSNMERRILMTARRLQIMEADPEFVKREEKRAAQKKADAKKAAAKKQDEKSEDSKTDDKTEADDKTATDKKDGDETDKKEGDETDSNK